MTCLEIVSLHELGLKRLKESLYDCLEKLSSRKICLCYVNSLAQIKIILKDCMNTQVNIGYHFLHLYFLLVKQIMVFQFLLSILDRRHKRRINRYLSEVNRLSMLGGGVGVGVGIRTSDNNSTGVMSHLILTMLFISIQTRWGS